MVPAGIAQERGSDNVGQGWVLKLDFIGANPRLIPEGLDETGAGNKGLYYTLDGKVLQIQRRAQGFGAFEASIMKLSLDAPTNAFFVKANGYIGFGRDPGYPIHSSTNAYLSAAGVWVNASSRE